MKKILFLTAILSIIIFNSCKKTEALDPNKPTIAFVLQTTNNPFFIDMQRGAEEAAKKIGVNLIVQASEREADVEKQMQITENFIQRNVDAICISPSGSKEIISAIVKANEAGVPVLIVDQRVDPKIMQESGAVIHTFIGSDNKEGGRLAGEYVAEKLNYKGNVAILEGIPGHETGDSRLSGFLSAIKKYKNIKVAASQTANWQRDQGFNVFQNILQANPQVQAVFAANDLMALGALEAVTLAQRNDIIVVGFDAVEDSRIAIKNGTMSASVAQFPDEMGRMAVELAHKIIKGEKIEKEYPVKIELITKEKIETNSTNSRK